MSLRRTLLVARRDLAELPTRPLYWIWAVFLAWNGYLMSRGSWIYRSVDTSVGSQVSWVNSEFQIAFVMGLIGFLLVGFFVALAVGMPLVRDATLRVGELLHATPLRMPEYVWGKFLAGLGGVLAVVGVLVGSTIFFSHVTPDPTSLDAYAPFAARNYVMPALVFLLPAVVLMSGAAMAIGAFFNRAILVFLLPVTTFLFYNQAYWGWFPADMTAEWALFFQHFDPSGFRWLKQNWLMLDRGIAFYNSTPIEYDALFLLSRLSFIALGLLLVTWTSRHLSRTLRGRMRVGRSKSAATSELAPPRWQKRLATLGMRAAAPSFWRGTRSVARFELRELAAHPSLYIFLPIVFITSFIVFELAARGQGGVFSPPILVTSGGAAAMTMASLNFWMGFLILFYAVESLRREWGTRVAPIYYATPVRTGAILLGKGIALFAVLLGIMGATFAAILVKIVQQPQVDFEWMPFAVIWGLLFLPTFAVWITFVTAVYALTNSRYTTYGVGLAAIGLTGWWATTGDMTWVTNWPLVTVFGWSDVSVFELDRVALFWNRLTVLGLAAAFAALAWYAFQRRDGDSLRQRARTSTRRVALAAAALCALPLVTGYQLWSEVHSSFQGDDARERRKLYWRQNVGTWGPGVASVTLPEMAHVELDVDLEPARRAFRAEGYYDLVNRTGSPLPWLPVTGGLYWDDLEWTLDGRPAEPEDRAGLYLFHLDEPLAPEARLRLGFRYRGVLNKGSTRNGIPGGTFEFLLDSGVVVTARNPDFVPVVGYVPTIGVDEDNRYESRIYPHNFHEGVTPGDTDRSWFTHRLNLSAPADYTVNSTGALTAERRDGDRKTWTWESDYPVRVWNVIAGRWDVKRGEHGTAVFYHPEHPYNVDAMLEALDGTRRYFSEWYYPYPWKELRLSEFPGIVQYARGNATNIFFSEAVGFLTAPDPRVDTAFTIAAHEAAHSWWGHIVGNGAGPGGIVLSEGGAHFATMMLLEELRGPLQRMVFARWNEAVYGENRQPSTEEPLARTDYDRGFADAVVIYDKGGWVFWMMLDHMGREAFLDGVREYFRTYHRNPDHPVIQDFTATMRPFAADPESYDRFVDDWFYGLEVPEYRIASAEKEAVGQSCAECSWRVRLEVLNAGGGDMPVDVAAVRGRRFERDGSVSDAYRDCRDTLRLGAGETKPLELDCDFEPERIVVDPDVMVLQLQRPAASVRLR